jgi:hypothetical protein
METAVKVKQFFLLFAFVAVSIIALLYGISPSWFAKTFLGLDHIDANIAHILRAVMGLYLAFGLFWCFAAFRQNLRDPAILTTIVFSAGLVFGRIISLSIEGIPSPLLVFYMAIEFVLIPTAIYVYRLPD